ncbi:hypothetical protein AU588_07885 [Salmonella enterica subsp. enterica serovar Agona]|nr:hypothetical protein [Salmonella enterica subsp. enterica serovar Agona]
MAINNFKPFATAANANVTSQTDWESLPALLSGFMAGKASSAQVNKAIRQASFIAAALAQYTANKSGQDVLDNGDLNGFITKMSAAFGKDFQALDATLTALAGLTTSADKLPYFTDTDKAAQTDLTQVGRDIIGKNTIADILTYLGLVDALFKGDGGFLAGTFVSDAIDRTSIGARAATGCQFMRAHQSPDAPDQVSYWQIITLTEVASPTSVVDVLAISGNNVVFGHGTGAGITSWRHVAMLEGADFTGDITAPNVRGKNSVTVGDGTGGMTLGNKDGAGFDGNNLNIKSWNGIGFQDASDDVIRAYISTQLGIIAASEYVYAGSANMYKNGDIYGDKWSTGNGPNWLSLYLEQLDSQIRNNLTSWTSNNFPTKADVSVALSGKPGRQYIKEVGVYQNDKTKPFMLHDDNSGIFLATTGMLPTAGLGINGWHRDNATGLITQWGSGGFTSGQRINFPAVFPNVCTAVVGNDTGVGTLAISMTDTDTHGFTVRGSSSNFGLNWIAKGY